MQGCCAYIAAFFSGEPRAMRAFHGTCILVWVALWIAGTIFDWVQIVAFVSHVSLATAVLTSWSAWQSSRVEVKQESAEHAR
jgi:hypothetical protein